MSQTAARVCPPWHPGPTKPGPSPVPVGPPRAGLQEPHTRSNLNSPSPRRRLSSSQGLSRSTPSFHPAPLPTLAASVPRGLQYRASPGGQEELGAGGRGHPEEGQEPRKGQNLQWVSPVPKSCPLGPKRGPHLESRSLCEVPVTMRSSRPGGPDRPWCLHNKGGRSRDTEILGRGHVETGTGEGCGHRQGHQDRQESRTWRRQGGPS